MAAQEDLNPAFWLAVAGLAWSAANTLYTRLSSGRRDLEGRVERAEQRAREDAMRLEKDLNGYGNRLSVAESAIGKLPTYEFLAREHGEMHEKMNGIASLLNELKGEMRAQAELREQDREARKEANMRVAAMYKKLMSESK